MTNAFNPLANLQSLVQGAVAVQRTDMTETSTGGAFESIVLEKGSYNCQYTEYVEYGKRTPMYQGKPTDRPPVLNVKVGFLFHDGQGNSVRIRSLRLGVSNSEKAAFKKFFDRLNMNGDIQHAAQKLGQGFRMEVDVIERDGKKYNTMKLETLSPLPKFDPNTGDKIELPELKPEDVKIFLWDNPTKETWDSLYIEGTNEKTGKSKNFIQEDILQAVDYNGSPLQALLEGGVPSPESLATPAPAAPTADTGAAPAAPVTPAAPAAPTAPAAPAAPTAPVAPVA